MGLIELLVRQTIYHRVDELNLKENDDLFDMQEFPLQDEDADLFL
jgi:hypothetical protein